MSGRSLPGTRAGTVPNPRAERARVALERPIRGRAARAGGEQEPHPARSARRPGQCNQAVRAGRPGRGLQVGATNAMNGDKLLPLGRDYELPALDLSVSYGMGKGLGSLLAQVKEP